MPSKEKRLCCVLSQMLRLIECRGLTQILKFVAETQVEMQVGCIEFMDEAPGLKIKFKSFCIALDVIVHMYAIYQLLSQILKTISKSKDEDIQNIQIKSWAIMLSPLPCVAAICHFFPQLDQIGLERSARCAGGLLMCFMGLTIVTCHPLRCITCDALPAVYHLLCTTCSASHAMHHLRCITCGASPVVHHLRCITCGASPEVHHLRCIA